MTINLHHIGTKIKQARQSSRLTQQQIADNCGISKSLLSKIENGQTASAVATLSKVSDALDIPLSWVLDDQPETDLIILANQEREQEIGDDAMGYSYELLAKSRFSTIEPTIVHVTPKDQNVRQQPYTHTEDEFIYVLKGTIDLYYDNMTRRMTKGDTAYFNGNNPHLFVPVDNLGAKLLTIFIEKQSLR